MGGGEVTPLTPLDTALNRDSEYHISMTTGYILYYVKFVNFINT